MANVTNQTAWNKHTITIKRKANKILTEDADSNPGHFRQFLVLFAGELDAIQLKALYQLYRVL